MEVLKGDSSLSRMLWGIKKSGARKGRTAPGAKKRNEN